MTGRSARPVVQKPRLKGEIWITMEDRMVGEGESNNEEATGSPMWKFLKEEYDYKRPKRGDIRYAEVLRIDDDEIIVDIGGKTEGVVPSVDLDRMGEEAISEIEVGDKVPVYVLRPESADGDVIVSLNMARTMEDWRKAEKLFEEGGVYEGTVSGHNKGGLLVYYGQIRGFVPASQISGLSRRSGHEERMEMLSKMEGRQLLLKVIEVDRQRRRLIFSERAASREWRDQRKDELLDQLQEGDIRAGTVRNLCDFGAFVDLGGADGLIHISELSWRRVKHARDVLRVGEEVEVYVLRVDRDRKRIGLSLKRLQPDPWHLVEEKYEVGQIVRGVITNITDFGAFARIEDGIEGLIHVSELSDGDFAPRDLVREGEELYVKVLSIDSTRQRMGLSLKQAPSREEIEGSEAWADLREEGEVEVEPEPEEGVPVMAEAEVDLEEPGAEFDEEEVVAAEAEEAVPVMVEGEVEVEPEPEEGVPVIAEADVDLEEPGAEFGEEEVVAIEAEGAEPVVVEAEVEVEPEEDVAVIAEAEVEEPGAQLGEAEEVEAEAGLEEPIAALGEEEEAAIESEEAVSLAVADTEVEEEADLEMAAPELEEEPEAVLQAEEESAEAEGTSEELEEEAEEQEDAGTGLELEAQEADESVTDVTAPKDELDEPDEADEEPQPSAAVQSESGEGSEVESADPEESALEDEDDDQEEEDDDEDDGDEDDDEDDEDDEDEGDEDDEDDEDEGDEED